MYYSLSMLSQETYEQIVRDALEALPKEFLEPLKNVSIVIDDIAPPQEKGILLGLYEGVPLTSWGRGGNGALPDKITLFKYSIEQVAKTKEEIPAIVRETLWHEIAHFFGFKHDQIHAMEERWRAKRSL